MNGDRVSDFIPGMLDSARLLFDLQQGNQIAQSLAGCLQPEEIARRVTAGLVQQFDCAFARIWLVAPDRRQLQLVASSGLYTRLDGSFATVPMGAYKVGKIAQNRVSFLSNQLAEESWVRDRDWAIANGIQGFAGYPLMLTPDRQESDAGSDSGEDAGRVLGVLAVFSQHPMAPEFLEVLQLLCTTVAITLETALQYRQPDPAAIAPPSLSDQLANLLPAVRLTLIGKEQPLPLPLSYVVLQTAQILTRLNCQYCRLSYGAAALGLEAMVMPVEGASQGLDWVRSHLGNLFFMATCLGGVLQVQTGTQPKVQQIRLQLPYGQVLPTERLQIQCRQSVLQLAFTQLAYLAGLQVETTATDSAIPLLTDDPNAVAAVRLWIQQDGTKVPLGVQGCVDLSVSPEALRKAVVTVGRGESWGLAIAPSAGEPVHLSDREREMMTLLAQGLRDRDIANQLFISESTVKFHINNILAKLKARTRYQALHQVITKGWIQ